MAISTGFASMLGTVRKFSQVEAIVASAIDRIRVEAKRVLNVETRAEVSRSSMFSTSRIDVINVRFEFTHPVGNNYAHISIESDAISGHISGVLVLKEFPGHLRDFVRNLPEFADFWPNSSGVPDQLKDDPPKSKRSGSVAKPAQGQGNPIALGAVALIDIATINSQTEEKTRRYIGASGISEECAAYHALSMRGFPSDSPTPQLIRIFNEGHRIEAMVVEMLKKSGHNVIELDPMTGKQWNFTACGGHYKCNLDGLIKPVGADRWMNLEVKSMNRDKFKSFKDKGVMLSHPSYYDQVQAGMGLMASNNFEFDGNPILQTFLIAYCKDNSQFHVEIVDIDAKRALDLFTRATNVVNGDCTRKSAYESYDCKNCFKNSACWRPGKPEDLSCSHCENAYPSSTGGLFVCSMTHEVATDVCDQFSLFKVKKA